MKTIHKILVLIILFPVCLYTVFGAKKIGFIQPTDLQAAQQAEHGDNYFGNQDCEKGQWWRRWWCRHKDGGGDGGGNEVKRLRTSGSTIIDPYTNKEIILNGYNWGWWDTAQPGDGAENKVQGATVVRLPIRWYFDGEKSDIRQTDAPGHISPEGLKKLDAYVNYATSQGLWVVLFGGSDKGAGNSDDNYWTNPALRQEYIEMWQFLAEHYKDTPYMGAYEILSEPHPPKPYTSKDLLNFYEEVGTAIRQVDPNIPLMIGANDHYEIMELEDVYSTNLKNVIYTFNFYEPTEYVKQTKVVKEQKDDKITKSNNKPADIKGSKTQIHYPGDFTSKKTGQAYHLDKQYLANKLQYAINFRNAHNVPIFNDQVGLRSSVPDSTVYIEDVLSLLNANKIGFTYWTYRIANQDDGAGICWSEKIKGKDEDGYTWLCKEDWKEIIGKYFKSF